MICIQEKNDSNLTYLKKLSTMKVNDIELEGNSRIEKKDSQHVFTLFATRKKTYYNSIIVIICAIFIWYFFFSLSNSIYTIGAIALIFFWRLFFSMVLLFFACSYFKRENSNNSQFNNSSAKITILEKNHISFASKLIA